MQGDYIDSLTHRHTALSEVLHALKMSTSLFNTVLSYRKLPPSSKKDHAISIEECAPYYDPTEFAVSLNIEASDESYAVDLEYWTDSLSDGQAAHVASTFLQALKNIMHHSTKPISHLSSLGDDQQLQIADWNQTIPVTINRCVHDVVKEQNMQRLSAQAICGWDASFTHQELDIAIEKLAAYLRRGGVQPGSFVCLCFDKSAYTIVAMIATMRAGGAIVCLDPAHPATALEMRIQDTQAQVVLCSPDHVARFADVVPKVVAVDGSLLRSLEAPTTTNYARPQPSDACLVVYTSGSTGKPKGVVIEHRALVTSVQAFGTAGGWSNDTRMLQFASYTFDNNFEEIFATLMFGGCVCVPSDYDRLYDLAGAINKLNVNMLELTPTVATYLEPSQVPTVKSIFFGGEALTRRVLDIWGDKVPIGIFYGPSECSINSAFRGGVRLSSEITSIGRAVGGALWIVDPSNHEILAPIGCEGEMLVEGPILAREYLNNPQKTKEAFIMDPLWAKTSGTHHKPRRFYKTGDLVRYHADGAISYRGRMDHQVKLHGQRIELGEIEHHVRSLLPSQWQFAVELITPGSKDAAKSLAVFVSPASADGVPAAAHESSTLPLAGSLQTTLTELDSGLRTALPVHMIPTVYVPLVKLPLSSAGKLDRRRLKTTAEELTGEKIASYRLAGGSGRAPVSEKEKALAQLWESILELPEGSVGMDAQFFRMGGDSIAAIRLVTAARARGMHLTVAKIFRQATLSEMCNSAVEAGAVSADDQSTGPAPFSLLSDNIDRGAISKEVATLCRISAEDIDDILPCTALQEGLVALSMKQPGAYVCKNTFQLTSVDLDKFLEAWKAVVASESMLRTRVVYTEHHGFLQVIVKESFSCTEGTSEIESSIPTFNGDKLTRFAVQREGPEGASLIWTMHHALYDGWSMPLILKRVQAIYEGSAVDASANSLYPRFVQYLSSLDEKESEGFWQERLADTASELFPALPAHAHEPAATSTLTHTTPFCRISGSDITMPSLIRSAWALTVAAYSNADDVVFAETVTGRDAPILSILDTFGPTIATIPTRVQIDRGLHVSQFLLRGQEEMSETLSHQHLGLQRIQRLSPETAKACEIQNLIAINGEAVEPDDEPWTIESGSAAGSGFHTYALIVSFDVGATEVAANAQFDPAIISEWQLKRVLSHFGFVLNQIGDPQLAQTALSQLETLNDVDRSTIEYWNQNLPAADKRCIQDVIRSHVRSQRDAPAVCAWDKELTYGQLDLEANALAQILAKNGIKAGSYVPVIFEKSSITVIAQLAVLKLGAAFVPLDGEAPISRLQGIVEDVGAHYVLCSPHFNAVGSSIGAQAIAIDRPMIETFNSSGMAFKSRPNDVAYVVYTSGSTGKPKGVMVQHGAFVSSALAHGPAMGMRSSSRVLQFAAPVFDASIMEVFTTLILGGCICIADEQTRLNHTAKAICDMGVNWALLTPSFAQLLQPDTVPGLKTLVLGGEAVTRNVVSVWSKHTYLINAYGPSEAAVVSTVNSHISSVETAKNIGYAVGGSSWVTDPSNPQHLVPIGSVGELLIEGPILAKGYLNDQERTAASFVGGLAWTRNFHSLRHLAHSRFYRTGDLVRYCENGSLNYIGRKDNQVKVRGQRLELSEVEHYLELDPLVRHVQAPTRSGSRLCCLWRMFLRQAALARA